MDPVTLDDIDRGLLHALQVDGRAPFSRIGAVLDVAERTVARRYNRLRGAGALRITGAWDERRTGRAEWVVRVQMRPDGTAGLARVLACRPDTAWVTVVSSGTEITCLFRTPDEAPLAELARNPKVLAVQAHRLLRHFMNRRWSGRTSVLSAEQVAALRGPAAESTPPIMTELDRRLVPVLAVDGRAPYPSLARAVGWSESAVRRRLDELRRTRLIRFDVETDPLLFGFTVQCALWLTVTPGQLAAVAQTIAADPEAAFVAATTGSANLLVIAVCRTVDDLFGYTTDRLGALPGVQHLEIAPIDGYFKRTAPPV
ncbi:Lrp/AsnC family transcriptional regulator [Nocardia brasiliensis]|uniref:AsnC family transcriptional regulator n=1 Tax=Nocardia brasiliensis (strain ATCC 700358 / HUJEG-1) TaxID=1133849 RepID=K0ETM6_NOCB7|nr:AsnC family transcriptional regulator [Nocardia brasiliensis]AFU03143.1 AsnC family transcriptional regulator [Nocardia brasiliensis ATCC 700358]OCF86977.1 AsnC family transcriptional regulator [Nocardia brasiliensis]